MYFPKISINNKEERELLLKRLSDWEREFGTDYSLIEWKAVFISEETENKWDLYSSVFYAHPKEYQEEEEFYWVYPFFIDKDVYSVKNLQMIDVLLTKRYLTFSDLHQFLRELHFEKKEIQNNVHQFKIKDLSFQMKPVLSINWNFNSRTYSYLEWVNYQMNIRLVPSPQQGNLPFPLFSSDGPYFTQEGFTSSFYNLQSIRPDRDSINVILPIYKAKINSLNLSGKTLRYRVDNNSENLMILKLTLRYERFYRKHINIEIPKGKTEEEIELEYDFDVIEASLALKNSPFLIQEETVGQHPVQLEGIEIPSSIEQLRAFTKVGEDQIREFKREFEQKDLLKEIIAFANSNDGIIIIGVEDDGMTYCGEKKNPQTIKTKLNDYVRRMCDPNDIEYEIIPIPFGEENYIYVTVVPEGKEKPNYHLDYNRFYIRARGSSQPLDRQELIRILKEKSSDWV